jgi:hypothetical protein
MELVPPLVYSLLGRDGIQRRADIIGSRELMRNTVSDLAAVLYKYINISIVHIRQWKHINSPMRGDSEMGTFHCEKEKYVMKNINNEMQVSKALKKQFMNKYSKGWILIGGSSFHNIIVVA